MSGLRTLVSALCILAAALLIAWWAVASHVVSQVEDGAAIREVTERALESRDVQETLSADLADRTEGALGSVGVDLGALGLSDDLEDLMSRGVGTDAFRATVVDQVDGAHGQVTEQLTDPGREPAPLTVTVDLSSSVNARIDELGGIAAALPDISVPAVPVELLDAEQFEQARAAYDRMVWAQQWGLWLGTALVILGFVVSHRRRWFFAKLFAVVGLMSLAFGGAVAVIGPEAVTAAMPGTTQGSLASMWWEVLAGEIAPAVSTRALWTGAISLLAATIAGVIGASVGGRRR